MFLHTIQKSPKNDQLLSLSSSTYALTVLLTNDVTPSNQSILVEDDPARIDI